MKRERIYRWILFIISTFIILGIYYYTTKAMTKVENISKDVVKIQEEAISEYINKKDLGISLKTDTEIYGIGGEKIGHIYRNNYKYVDYNDISKEAINAYKAVEDRRFDTHKGIDYMGIIRAAKSNYDSGATTQGGSTITQQLIKNSIVGKERSYKRKLKELFIAPNLEKDKGKDWIMEKYLNTNFYGNGVYGIGYAADYYFGKKASDLTYKDAALLIAITNGPSKYNPRTNRKATLEKAKSNYRKIYEAGYIDKKTYDENVDKDYELVFKKPKNTRTDKITTLALYDATLELMKNSDFEFKFRFNSREEEKEYKEHYYKTYKNTMDKISLGGYRIYTNIDKNMYSESEKAIENVLSKVNNEIEAVSIIIDNQNQYLISATGGRKDDEFNRAFQALRQPGSLVKALYTYPASMEKTLLSFGDYEIDEKIDGDYSPNNVDFKYRGSMMLRDALARSINTIAFKMLDKVGTDVVSDMVCNYNIASTTYIDYFNKSISLGGLHRGWSPYEVTKAFSSIVNDGYRSKRNIVTKIVDENGNILVDNGTENVKNYGLKLNDNINQLEDTLKELKINYSFNKENIDKNILSSNIDNEIKVMNRETSQSIIDALKYSVELPYGTAHRLKNILKIKDEYVSKTGTTTMSRDGWNVIMTPRYTVLTWVGYDKPKSENLYGSTYPLTISANIINKLYSKLGNYKPMKFEKDEIVKVIVNKDGLITYVTNDMNKDYGSIGIDSLNKRLTRDYDKYQAHNKRIEEENELRDFENNYKKVNIEDKENGDIKETDNKGVNSEKEEVDPREGLNLDKTTNVLSDEDINNFENLNKNEPKINTEKGD